MGMSRQEQEQRVLARIFWISIPLIILFAKFLSYHSDKRAIQDFTQNIKEVRESNIPEAEKAQVISGLILKCKQGIELSECIEAISKE
jgi:hypothetical protein